MKNMGSLLRQAQQMQSKISTLQKELDGREIESSAGGGMVKIRVNGKQEILEIKINRECVDPTDVDTLEDLVKAAVNQAIGESQEMVSNAMAEITGGAHIPGLF